MKQQIMYRYRLNENWKASNSASVEGINLSREWRVFNTYQEKLQKRIKTTENIEGILDYEQYDAKTGGIVNSSVSNFNKKLPMYKRDVLATMTRPQLIEIVNVYNISPINKRDEFLIKLILEKQEEIKNTNKQEKQQINVNNLRDIKKKAVLIES